MLSFWPEYSIDKSIAFVSPNVNQSCRVSILQVTGIRFTDEIGKYLGVPIMTERCSKRHFEFIIEKVQSRLSNWKSKNLSLAGRCTLIHSVLAGVPSYAMQTTWLPQGTCDALNRLSRNFLWGTNSDRKKLHLVNWKHVTKPKDQGGLGIRDARKSNIALLAKLGGQLVHESGKVWSQVLKAKYVKNDNVLELQPRSNASYTWRGILRSLNHVHGGFGWTIASGREVSLWFDAWLSSEPLCLSVEEIDPNEILWRVADIINDEGQWVVARIKTILPTSILQAIQSFTRDTQPSSSDKNVWKGNSDGIITARSLYQFITATEDTRGTRKWKWIWKLKCP